MRTLLGGIVAAVASAAAWMALEHIGQQELGWFTIVVGLVTGCGVRIAAGSSGESYARGALATVLALVAIVGGRQVYSQMMEQMIGASAPITQVSADSSEGKAEAGEAAAGTSSGSSEDDLAKEYEMLNTPSRGGKMMSTKEAVKDVSPMDIVFLCIASLVAYVTGKGGKAALVSEVETSDGEPATDEATADEGDAAE